ncbi:MAG: glutamine--fructose-6-phosphate transaminase (isomerizing) [Rhabdochlamydiaceae bacterium]
MCGIFGYVGPQDGISICLSGLKNLEYRGYDSAGVAGIHDQAIFLRKEVGKIDCLQNALKDLSLDLNVAIAHTRWATHGQPSQVNAHPQLDSLKQVAVVHNGIVENHADLRRFLISKGVVFQSDTDTEVIAQLVAFYYQGDILEAVKTTLSQLRGFWGLCVIHKNHPDMIIAAAKESPLCIGTCSYRKESQISSDSNAFNNKDLDVMFLHSDEIAVVEANHVHVFDANFSLVKKNVQKIEKEEHLINKNGHDHFMLKEILEQPKTIQQAMHNRFIMEFGTADFENLTFTPQDLLSVKRIIILACGTSWHAGCIAASMIEDKARIPASAEIASEFRYRNPIIDQNTLVIAISQSGETLDTLAAVKEVKTKGAKVLAVCNVRNSSLTREADSCLFLRAGPEISVCSTKAFTSQLTVLALFTLMLARLHHMSKEEGQLFLHELQALPKQVEEVLAKKEQIQEMALKYVDHEQFFFLGRQYMYPTSLEAALKLKEISYLPASGYPAGEMKHGPIALINEKVVVVGMCGCKKTYDKTLSNLAEVKSRGAPILAFASQNAKNLESVTQDIIYLPEVIDELSSVPFAVATQLFAYYVAKLKGCDIDQPKNLAKSVTVE